MICCPSYLHLVCQAWTSAACPWKWSKQYAVHWRKFCVANVLDHLSIPEGIHRLIFRTQNTHRSISTPIYIFNGQNRTPHGASILCHKVASVEPHMFLLVHVHHIFPFSMHPNCNLFLCFTTTWKRCWLSVDQPERFLPSSSHVCSQCTFCVHYVFLHSCPEHCLNLFWTSALRSCQKGFTGSTPCLRAWCRGLMHQTPFISDYTSLTKDGAEWIVNNTAVELIGIDYTSIAIYEDLPGPHYVLLEKVCPSAPFFTRCYPPFYCVSFLCQKSLLHLRHFILLSVGSESRSNFTVT